MTSNRVQLADEEAIDTYVLERNERMGMILLTVSREHRPLGSLLLDPIDDELIINDFSRTISEWNTQFREQKAKRERIESNVRGKRKDTQGY